MPPQRTKHGVLDLNGPNLNGRNYNGRASASCPHFRALDFPTYRVEELIDVVNPDTGQHEIKKVGVNRCTNCDQERWTDADDGATE